MGVERSLPFQYHQRLISLARFCFPRQTYKDPAFLLNHYQIQLLHMHCQVYLEPAQNLKCEYETGLLFWRIDENI